MWKNFAILCVAALALVPALAMAAIDRQTSTATRQIEMRGPIRSFTQTQGAITLRLEPASRDIRRTILVRDGSEPATAVRMAIRGSQTYVRIRLPVAMERAERLVLAVSEN